jgi:hypothetical protein
MPNNVINEIIFHNVGPVAQGTILDKTLNQKGLVDFNILVPVPLNIWQGSVGDKEEKAFGRKDWYSWNIENWDTKWNAYGMGDDGNHVIRTEDSFTIVFQTASSPPRGWLVALFNAVKLPFDHNWLNEGAPFDGYIEKYFFSDYYAPSPEWEQTVADKDMIRHLQILLYGSELEDEDEG